MEIKMVPLSAITPYKNNPRRNADAVKYVRKSIEQFGFKVPMVLDAQNIIVCGHTRFLAAQEMGMEEVPCVYADDLSEEQIKAFRLADNKTAEAAEWDFDALEIELQDITGIDMSGFGFTIEEEQERVKEMAEEQGEVPFTEILGEENNYLVLQFKTEIDWINAQTLFDIKKVKAYSTRKDGKITKGMEGRHGLARVLDGAQALRKIMGDV